MVSSAVVFAYHEVGVRCLAVLLAHGVEVALVVTHADDPNEEQWFASVAACAKRNRLPVMVVDRSDDRGLTARLRAIKPDLIFSFYCRFLLTETQLAAAQRGALNMHGSLLPVYRGRAPVNWAIIKGEAQTGASLHYMTVRPDAGDLVDQQAVPILYDDTALDVFKKVAVAAELVLDRSLPRLLAGRAPRRVLDPDAGSYYGRRRPADGRIDWSAPAWTVHNLIRGVAPPYPGAFTSVDGRAARILLSHWCHDKVDNLNEPPCLYAREGHLFAACADGVAFEIISLEIEDEVLEADQFMQRYGSRAVRVA